MNMRKIYRKVAKEYGVSVEEVKREMQAAITDAYTNPLNNNGITKTYQSRDRKSTRLNSSHVR